MQDMGPKKYREMVQKENSFYDKHKAGKKDPKTGQYYHHISTTDPRLAKSTSGTLCGYLECKTENCNEYYRVSSNSAGYICNKCGKYISITKEDKVKVEKERSAEKSQKQEIESLD